MSKYVFKYYVRCSHGISATYCETCIYLKQMQGQVLPMPFNGTSYTLEECKQHFVYCCCDGCAVYRPYE